MNEKLLKRQKRFLLLLCSFLVYGAMNSFAQITVSGVVESGTENAPLPGVNVVVKGTSIGTITGTDGKYTISVPSADDVLVFSMIGMVTEEIKVGNQTTINLTMIVDMIGLDELVVVGYGTMRKSDISGAIVSVKSDELVEIKSSNVLEALQGRVAGMDVGIDDGRPGANIAMKVRGQRSFNAETEPLIIIDGIPVGADVDINPNDIESIEVLKDAASTAIYGSRGTNGIIIITTKKGSDLSGKSRVYYNGYYSLAEPAQKIPVMGRDTYYTAKVDAFRDYRNLDNWSVDPDPTTVFGSTELEGFENNTTTDWQDLITRQGYQQDHHLGVMGGSERFAYNASVSYFDEKGVVIESAFKRYSANLNLEAYVNKHLTAGTLTNISHKILDGADVSSSNYSVFTNAVRLSPMVEPYDSIGNYIWTPSAPNPRHSPLATVDDVEEHRTTKVFSSVYADIMIFKGLNFRSTVGVDYELGRRGWVYPQKDPESALSENGIEMNNDGSYTWNNVITFNKTFSLNRLIITGVHEIQRRHDEYYMYRGEEPEEIRSLWYNFGTNNLETDQISSKLEETSLVSVLGRLNYTFNDRYIFNASLRADAASQLAPGYKWQYFPATSVAWRVSEESFMENIKSVVSDLKIRLSYGTTGNASIDPYSVYPGVNTWPLYVEFGEDDNARPVLSFRPTTLASADLTWERTKQINLGFDISLFRNRLVTNIDLYKANTDNILMVDRLPANTGFFFVDANSASTETKGIELSIQSVNVSTPAFSWTTNLVFSANREKITGLVSGVEQDIANGWFVGQPIDVIYDYRMTGIRQIGDLDTIYTGAAEYLPGDILVDDTDFNDTINNDDMVILGQESPKWIANFENTIRFNGLSLSFSIYAKWGHMIDAEAYDWDPRMLNNLLDVPYWMPNNPGNEYPRLDASITETDFESVISYRDASFIKLRQVTLSYELPVKWFGSLPVSRLNVYVSSKNTAYLYTKVMKGIDPERNGSISWPLARLYTFGINASF